MAPELLEPIDPAADIALSGEEILWLDELLASDEVPDTAMPLEALDGFFTALVIGPGSVAPAEYMPIIWDTQERTAPVFEEPEQVDTLNQLLSRHWNAISRRIDAGYPHLPLLEDKRPGQEGCAWCYGFMIGVGMRVQAWQPLLNSRKMGPLLALITGLAELDELAELEESSSEERAEIVEALAGIPLVFSEFWRDRAAGLPSDEPARSTKIGRNEPCPCGSGRKYKQCCGAGGSPLL